MKLQPFMRVAATLALLCAEMPFHQGVNAQVIDFSQIDTFEINGHRHATRGITSEDNYRRR